MYKPNNLTDEDFQEHMREFFSWCSHRPRPLAAWFVSLRTYAAQQLESSIKEQDRRKKEYEEKA